MIVRPLVIGSNVWRVIRVNPGDPFLIDRTGVPKLATTDPTTKTIRMSTDVPLAMYDKVFLHEAAHALMWEAGVTDLLSQVTAEREQVFLEELLAWFLESHSIQVIDAATRSLGRPLCVDGLCAVISQ